MTADSAHFHDFESGCDTVRDFLGFASRAIARGSSAHTILTLTAALGRLTRRHARCFRKLTYSTPRRMSAQEKTRVTELPRGHENAAPDMTELATDLENILEKLTEVIGGLPLRFWLIRTTFVLFTVPGIRRLVDVLHDCALMFDSVSGEPGERVSADELISRFHA